ncbi:MAG: hypothetical protein II062_06385 [Oscillospiraceae bacterium]|nr:hypothetical protein [Oscillospiraceae bacterium]
MKTCIYFVEKPGFPASAAELPPGAERLVRGWGFTPEGRWRPLPLPAGAAGLLLDDRFPPSDRGAAEALRALDAWEGLILLDLERPPGPGTAALAELIRQLAGHGPVLPSAWAALPHGAVLIGPRIGGDFPRWLAQQRRHCPAVVLDALPLRHAAQPRSGARAALSPPGTGWRPWTGPLPGSGFPCPGAGCLHRRLPDGSVLLWDTKETLTQRCRAAGVPCLVFREDWERLEP